MTFSPSTLSLLQADKLLAEVDNPAEFILDGKVMAILSRLCRQEVESVSANAVRFTPDKYGRMLKAVLDLQAKQREDDDGAKAGVEQWAALGEERGGTENT